MAAPIACSTVSRARSCSAPGCGSWCWSLASGAWGGGGGRATGGADETERHVGGRGGRVVRADGGADGGLARYVCHAGAVGCGPPAAGAPGGGVGGSSDPTAGGRGTSAHAAR